MKHTVVIAAACLPQNASCPKKWENMKGKQKEKLTLSFPVKFKIQ